MANYRFGKVSRLLTAKDFRAVFNGVQLKVSSRHLLLLARYTNKAYPRLGLVVAKKVVRQATQRNRVKRLIRENFRLQPGTASIDVIVLARRGLDQMPNKALHQLVQQLWCRLQHKAKNAC